jgi:transposase-like protein
MKLFKVICTCPSKENNKIPKYLGDIRGDIAVIGRYHCQNCGETYEVSSDGNGRIYRRIVTRAKLIAVHCLPCEERFLRTHFLGNFQRDVINQGRFHCKDCNKTYKLESDIDGEVTTAVVEGIVSYPDNLTVIGD